jgi:hypothetical protein
MFGRESLFYARHPSKPAQDSSMKVLRFIQHQQVQSTEGSSNETAANLTPSENVVPPNPNIAVNNSTTDGSSDGPVILTTSNDLEPGTYGCLPERTMPFFVNLRAFSNNLVRLGCVGDGLCGIASLFRAINGTVATQDDAKNYRKNSSTWTGILLSCLS